MGKKGFLHFERRGKYSPSKKVLFLLVPLFMWMRIILELDAN